MQRPSKILSRDEARQKIHRFCAYQERSHQDVKNKLFAFGLHGDAVDEIISELITEGFLNEERFAKAFARGKFRMKQWGRLKIIHELEYKGLTSNCINAGLAEIDEESYAATLRALLSRKSSQLAEENDFVRRDKIASYLIQKGYEPDLVWKLIKEESD